jgi:hypothetical protein
VVYLHGFSHRDHDSVSLKTMPICTKKNRSGGGPNPISTDTGVKKNNNPKHRVTFDVES